MTYQHQSRMLDPIKYHNYSQHVHTISISSSCSLHQVSYTLMAVTDLRRSLKVWPGHLKVFWRTSSSRFFRPDALPVSQPTV